MNKKAIRDQFPSSSEIFSSVLQGPERANVVSSVSELSSNLPLPLSSIYVGYSSSLTDHGKKEGWSGLGDKEPWTQLTSPACYHTATSVRWVQYTFKQSPRQQPWLQFSLSLSLHLNGYFPGGPGLADDRTSPFWILLDLRVMEVVERRPKLQSNRHHQQTNTQLFTGRMPFLSPNQQCQSTEGKIDIDNTTTTSGFCLTRLFFQTSVHVHQMPPREPFGWGLIHSTTSMKALKDIQANITGLAFYPG